MRRLHRSLRFLLFVLWLEVLFRFLLYFGILFVLAFLLFRILGRCLSVFYIFALVGDCRRTCVRWLFFLLFLSTSFLLFLLSQLLELETWHISTMTLIIQLGIQ